MHDCIIPIYNIQSVITVIKNVAGPWVFLTNQLYCTLTVKQYKMQMLK